MPKKKTYVKQTDKEKPWNKKANASEYKLEEVETNKTILIVSEGQTEELYFSSFPVLTLTVKCVNLKGQGKLKMIELTEDIIKNGVVRYDEVWCVFDMDVNKGAKEFADFDNAIVSGLTKGYKIAYSNDAFELWFYLHYQYTDQPNHRSFYYNALGEKWGCNYEKDGKKRNYCESIYAKLANDPAASQKEALARAKKLYRAHEHATYHEQNPITTYRLVNFLNENLRK
ncbi:MAG: RloB family protein [Paludibacteraceae bacterium]|nr:RloB family protein [Paludibacteraceae bacterium]